MKSSTWVRDYQYKWYESLAMNIIKMGSIPYHIAFIMDGNRRYAKNANIQKIDGHSKGFEKLAECLKWCLDVGVKEVTTFAFSIENFKRNKDEVEQLLDLAREKFSKLLEEKESIHENGVRIRIIGNLSLLPQDLQQIMAKVTLMTENNSKLFLNIAFAYTSRDEIAESIRTIVNNFDDDELDVNDIDDTLLRHCLYTHGSPDPDLLIRTSGESRISDFLMWQGSNTVLYFTKIYWPAIKIWHFLSALFTYQRSIANIWLFNDQRRDQCEKIKSADDEILPERAQNFLRKVNARRHDYLVNLANAKLKNIE